MLHGLGIDLIPFVGMCMGLPKALPLDRIIAFNDSGRRLIGHIGTQDNAMCKFDEHLRFELMEDIRNEVEKIRLERGGNSVSKRFACQPDPKAVTAYVLGELHKKTTTIIMPPGADDDDDGDDGDYLEEDDDE